MRRLFRTEFVRLWNSVLFRFAMLFSAGLSVFIVLARWIDIRNVPQYYQELGTEYTSVDGILFAGWLYLVFAQSIVVTTFLGTEYSDGTIRNKLIAGKTRREIYLSELWIAMTASLFLFLLHFFIMLGFGGMMLGFGALQPMDVLKLLFLAIAAILVFCAILVLFSLLISSKATVSVSGLLFAMIMLMMAITVYSKLMAPEYYDAYKYVDEQTGQIVEVEAEKNDHYLAGTKRKVYEAFHHLSPMSQLYQVVVQDVGEDAAVLELYDVILLIGISSAGIFLFEKKNIK